ncbi:MAG: hypothetical protein IPM24_06605 [Bryobacterales bacterium]|jgi:hypothetical protein|nr:hypothetical protein [Bryobacterales bacterium]
MIPWEAGKTEYNEDEAAGMLGLSVEELRVLVREQFAQDETEADIPVPTFRHIDLLMLKMLAQREAVS